VFFLSLLILLGHKIQIWALILSGFPERAYSKGV
jgi:hypothetical protein